jgi:sulfur-oxidizing protein SoxX
MIPIARILLASCAAAIAGCATVAADTDYRQAALDLIRQDFRSAGPATVDRVAAQDEAQRLCSQYPAPARRPPEVAARIEAAQLAAVRQPADGKYLGQWQEGEKIAQNGRGMQSSDAIGAVNGGNCYACHQIGKKEISFGNIGPSLYQYGKLRGNSEEIVRYTWNKLYNAQAYSACSNMPRFGHNGVLSDAQLKDVMALLLDPKSPVNE